MTRCAFCNVEVSVDLPLDHPNRAVTVHKVPRARGGSDRPRNRATACTVCEHAKGPLTANEYVRVLANGRARKQQVRKVMASLGGAASVIFFAVPPRETRGPSHETGRE